MSGPLGGIFFDSHCTLDYKFLFNYLQLWRSYAKLSEASHRFFLHFTRT